MSNGEVVKTRTITYTYDIRKWDVDGVIWYDWVTSTGVDSDQLYESVDEADDAAADFIG